MPGLILKGQSQASGGCFSDPQKKGAASQWSTSSPRLNSEGGAESACRPGGVEVEARLSQHVDMGPLPLHPNLCHVTEMLRGLSSFPGATGCFRWKRGLRQRARPAPSRPSQPRLCANQRPRPAPAPQARSSEPRAGTSPPITVHRCADTQRHRQ